MNSKNSYDGPGCIHSMTNIEGLEPILSEDWPMKTEIESLMDEAHEIATNSGFWEMDYTDRETIDLLKKTVNMSLIGTEVAESIEGIRKGTADQQDPHCPT